MRTQIPRSYRMTPKRKEPDLSTYAGRFAARLRALRDRAGLSVEEVVDRMATAGFAITPITYYTWEIGTRQVNLNAIPAISAALRIKNARTLFPER